MVQLFSPEEKLAAFAVKKRLWRIFGAVSFATLGVCLAVFFLCFHRTDAWRAWAVVINCFLTAVYGCFCLFFFAIKFKLTRSFIKMLKGFDKGLREERTGIFTEYDATPVIKDGVYCYTLVTSENYNKRNEDAERRIMVECTRTPPPFEPGDRVHYFTHANFLVEYEVYPRIKLTADD